MYVIAVYDANIKRVTKYMKILRRYLHHVQNSVFEGELTNAKFKKMKQALEKINFNKSDSIILYTFHNSKYVKRLSYGEKRGIDKVVV